MGVRWNAYFSHQVDGEAHHSLVCPLLVWGLLLIQHRSVQLCVSVTEGKMMEVCPHWDIKADICFSNYSDPCPS